MVNIYVFTQGGRRMTWTLACITFWDWSQDTAEVSLETGVRARVRGSKSHLFLPPWLLPPAPASFSLRESLRESEQWLSPCISFENLRFHLAFEKVISNTNGNGKIDYFSPQIYDTIKQLYGVKFHLPFRHLGLASAPGSTSIQMNNWLVSVLSSQIHPWSNAISYF